MKLSIVKLIAAIFILIGVQSINAQSPLTVQAPCTNLDFENDTVGWTRSYGRVSKGGAGAPSPIYTHLSYGGAIGFQKQNVIVSAGIDYFGGFPRTIGSKSLRLGDSSGTGAYGARIEQKFLVTSSNTNFIFNYAAVLQDGGHQSDEQPFIGAEFFDSSGTLISCSNLLIVAPGVGWQPYPNPTNNQNFMGISYKDWTSVSINLVAYVGQNVTVRFTSVDCSQGGHFGYAYIDCSCGSFNITGPSIVCPGASTTLSVTTGASGYSWQPGGQTATSISVSSSVTTTYTCNVTTQGVTPCTQPLTFTLAVVDPTVLPTASTTGSARICQNSFYELMSGEASATNGNISWSKLGFQTGTITNGNTLTPRYTPVPADAGTAVVLQLRVARPSCPGYPDASASANYTINVDPAPIATVTGASTVCQNVAVTVNTASFAYGTPSWTENGSGLIISGANTATPTYQPVANDVNKTVVLTMTVTGSNSCSSDTIRATYSIKVDTLLYTLTGLNEPVCQNTSKKTIAFTVKNGVPPYTLTYNVGGLNQTVTGSAAKKIIDVNTSEPGTFVYKMVNFSDANCPQNTSVVTTVTVNPIPDAVASSDTSVCRNGTSSLYFKATVGKKPFTYSYNYATNNVRRNVTRPQSSDSIAIGALSDKTGVFTYSLISVTDSNTCKKDFQDVKSTLTVVENPVPLFTITPEVTSILEPNITISNMSISATAYRWNFGDGNESSVQQPGYHLYQDTGSYKIKLMVYNQFCKDSTYQTAKIYLPLTIYFPTAFSPNGDGINDIFRPEADGIVKAEMLIYDRWGMELFHSDDIRRGWDGKVEGGSGAAQSDTYVYIVNLKTHTSKHDYVYRGEVYLIR